jgi:hypothetical protein
MHGVTLASAGLLTLLIALADPSMSNAQQAAAHGEPQPKTSLELPIIVKKPIVVKKPAPCETYRRGPLKTESIAVYYEPAGQNPKAYNLTEIRFRPKYLPDAALSLPAEQTDLPNMSELFYIDLAGQPLPKPPRQIWRRPEEDMYFQLLINGLAYYPSPERMIAILSSSKSYTGKKHVENGVLVQDPVLFERTGEKSQGYERIVVPDAAESRIKDHELSVRLEADGRVGAVLECASAGTSSNPQCNLYEKVGVFEANISFRRSLMPKIDDITRHARAFVSCLTWKDG